MNKRTPKPVPLAAWSGSSGKVRLVLPTRMADHFRWLLIDVTRLKTVRLNTPTSAAQAAAKSLASDMVMRRAVVMSDALEQPLRLTVPHSEALTLLAWLLSSPRTDDAASPLRLLIDALYQLLS